MPRLQKVSQAEFKKQVNALATRPEALLAYVGRVIPALLGPKIGGFSPRRGQPGTMIRISGQRFSTIRSDNLVIVGGKPALIVEAHADTLLVITDRQTSTGPVTVEVAGKKATGPFDFTVVGYPSADAGDNGPPIYFTGKGSGSAGDVPSTGTLDVLVVLVNPTDRTPGAGVRNTIVTAWGNVHTFYEQASYARLDVDVDVTANWHTVTGTFNDYVTTAASDPDAPNIRPGVLDRLTAEAAQAAVNEGFDLDDYDVMVCVLFLNGTFIRAWGGWSSNNFSYNDGAGTNINITVDHQLNLIAISETADWGRCAHELGHNIVSVPAGLTASPGAAILKEDVYASDLVDPTVATATSFDMMGEHDDHPLFSAYYMSKLGYYQASNILNLQWDRNAFNQEYEVVAHGLTENAAAARYHLIKLHVGDGLYYYIEARQRPGTTTQVFDPQIPLNGAPQQGGVVVTKVFTDTVNMNQQLRFVTLLHDVRVLKQGGVATDPARALTITVTNDHVVNRPLVCRVRVAWAQGNADDPNGAFDLRVEPWDGSYQTPDIWVDRAPYGAYDQPRDSANRPQGNGDKPRPGEVNLLWARVHNDGAVDASNVRLTYYVVEPPGVGDNGNWAPLGTKTITTVAKNGYADGNINWVPEVGRHTCLKVWAEQQFGEVTGGNNWAQENVFQFEAPASSMPAPVQVPIAVRNPKNERALILISVKGVPRGYTVHFPHSWVWLDGLGEKRLTLTVIPEWDLARYRKEEVPQANVRVTGDLPRSYQHKVKPGTFPGSRMFAIGGVTAQVKPKARVTVKLQEDREKSTATVVAVTGTLKPGLSGQRVRVDLSDPAGRLRVVETTTGGQGAFSAQFKLTEKPSLEAKPTRREREKVLFGIYVAQAFVFNAPHAAEAASNEVLIERT